MIVFDAFTAAPCSLTLSPSFLTINRLIMVCVTSLRGCCCSVTSCEDSLFCVGHAVAVVWRHAACLAVSASTRPALSNRATRVRRACAFLVPRVLCNRNCKFIIMLARLVQHTYYFRIIWFWLFFTIVFCTGDGRLKTYHVLISIFTMSYMWIICASCSLLGGRVLCIYGFCVYMGFVPIDGVSRYAMQCLA